MNNPYNSYPQDYGHDSYVEGSYGHMDCRGMPPNFDNGMKMRGMDRGREQGRGADYNRDGGRGGNYGYEGQRPGGDGQRPGGDRGGDGPRPGGDRGGDGQRPGGDRGGDGQRNEYGNGRFSDASDCYDDGSGTGGVNRERERDRDRSRRDRDRRDSRRHRDHDRSRERRDRGGRDRDRDRSPSSRYDDNCSQDGSDDGYRDRDRDGGGGGEKWMTDTPTNTILLRGLPPHIDEKDVRVELVLLGPTVKDVRLMRRSTGASRGFAFVEFQNVTDAQRWMAQKQGSLCIQNQHNVTMHYSTPRVGPEKFVQHKTDWTCTKCGVHNFKRRDYCFKCNISREESDTTRDGDGFDQVGTNPCNTLIFRGLDALTTEESLDVALRMQCPQCQQCKNVRIIRDPVTNTSRGYGFCEMNSIQESTQILAFLTENNVPLEVDGKQVLVAYAKNTFSTVMATLNSTGTQAWDYTAQTTGGVHAGTDYYYQGAATATTAATTGEVDPAYYYDGQTYDYAQYYGTTDTTNAAAAVAQAAIAQANAAKNYNKQPAVKKAAETVVEPAAVALPLPAVQATEFTEMQTYPAPDVSTYQFDKTSGYYYDPTTGLYYDANTQYYYNPQTQQFMYWNAEKSTYLPSPAQTEQSADGGDEKNRKDGKDKKEKVKIAKKIAKDMEKWAKSLNAQKEMLKDTSSRKITIGTGIVRREERESAAADAGFAVLEKSKTGIGEDKKLMPPPPMMGGGGKVAIPPPGSKPGLVASYGGDSDEEEEDDGQSSVLAAGRLDENKLLDWSKLACLLCKRQFQSREILTKHTQFSDLHKQNLESLRSSAPGPEEKKEYRDRAKERRQKYGTPQPPEPKKRFKPPPPAYEEPTNSGLGGDNIGNKLMQKMGWAQGSGLGKKAQGIVNPIQAKRRVQNTGLGLSGSNVVTDVADTYKDAVKKTFFARYNEQD